MPPIQTRPRRQRPVTADVAVDKPPDRATSFGLASVACPQRLGLPRSPLRLPCAAIHSTHRPTTTTPEIFSVSEMTAQRSEARLWSSNRKFERDVRSRVRRCGARERARQRGPAPMRGGRPRPVTKPPAHPHALQTIRSSAPGPGTLQLALGSRTLEAIQQRRGATYECSDFSVEIDAGRRLRPSCIRPRTR